MKLEDCTNDGDLLRYYHEKALKLESENAMLRASRYADKNERLALSEIVKKFGELNEQYAIHSKKRQYIYYEFDNRIYEISGVTYGILHDAIAYHFTNADGNPDWCSEGIDKYVLGQTKAELEQYVKPNDPELSMTEVALREARQHIKTQNVMLATLANAILSLDLIDSVGNGCVIVGHDTFRHGSKESDFLLEAMQIAESLKDRKDENNGNRSR